MKLNCLLILTCVVQLNFIAQISPTDKEFEAQPIGIKDQLEHILETQLNLPKIVLRDDLNEKETVFMNIDSNGHAFNLKFDKGLNNLVRNEIKRILGFVHFKRTLHLPNEEAPYFINIPLSSHAYKNI